MDKTHYFQQELKKIRELAKHFAEYSPEHAVELGAEAFDPDIERLLEGFAFLTADIQERLDADFPEFLRTLAQTICPELLLPTPSATMLAFKPRDNLMQTVVVPKGTQVDSKPQGNITSHFQTCYDVSVSPLRLVNVASETVSTEKGDFVRFALTFDARKIPLSKLNLTRLPLFLAGEYSEACKLFYLLTNNVRDMTIVQGKKAVAWLSPRQLKPSGFDDDHNVFTRPQHDMTEFGLLKEYFVFPEKFLMFDLDLSPWNVRASGHRFILVIDCDPPSFDMPEITKKSIVINVVPAINMFSHVSEPVSLDHKQENVPLRISGKEREYAEIYKVEEVEGILKKTGKKRKYTPFHQWTPHQSDQPYFKLDRLAVSDVYQEFSLTVAYPKEQAVVEGEVLTASLLCTNGAHAEQLLPGSIDVPSFGTSEMLEFTNLTKPSKYYPRLEDPKTLAFLIAHLHLNQMSLSNAKHVQSLISHYLPPGENQIIHKRRIDAIVDFEVNLKQQLLDRYFIQGQALFMRVNGDAFLQQGDLYLFGSILSHIFSSSVAMNTATQLTIENQVNGEILSWPTRLGEKRLL